MSYGLHVIKNPAGTFSYVGSLPIELGELVKPTPSDIMAGRFIRQEGVVFAVKFPAFNTAEKALQFASEKGFTAKYSD